MTTESFFFSWQLRHFSSSVQGVENLAAVTSWDEDTFLSSLDSLTQWVSTFKDCKVSLKEDGSLNYCSLLINVNPHCRWSIYRGAWGGKCNALSQMVFILFLKNKGTKLTKGDSYFVSFLASLMALHPQGSSYTRERIQKNVNT